MTFLEFQNKLKEYLIFSIRDIEKVFLDFDTRRLVEWQHKGYIKKIRNRYYYFANFQPDEYFMYLAANKIYKPSYISFETALSYYNLIPEGVYRMISATSLKTNEFDTPLGVFSYRHLKPELLFGYRLVAYKNQRYKIASIEKALLDYLYLNKGLQSYEDFEELRLHPETKEYIDENRFNKYLKLFNSGVLERKAQMFLKHISYINA